MPGYPGISLPFGLNGKLWGDTPDANVTVTLVKHGHTIGLGYELQDKQVYGRDSSSYGTGFFGFYGAYTGNLLGDFLLGYAGAGLRNLPLNTFGLDRSLLSGIHAEDSWKVRPNLTLNVGLRYEYWSAPHFVAGNASTWDPARNIIIAGTDNGKLNLTHQASAAFVAAATQGLWEPQTAAGIKNLIPGNGHFEPRIGIAWQPAQQRDVVLRAAYGVYVNNFTGNRAASDIGAIPFFSLQETQEGTTPVDYRTMFPVNPSDFLQPSVNYTTSLKIDEAKTQEWNLSFETAMPLGSTFTLGYIGTKSMGQPFAHDYNSPPPGKYANLAAAQLHPAYGSIYVMENGIDTWYHGLQAQWERRNHNGLYYMVSYMWSKGMSNHALATGELSVVDPYAPASYERGILPIDNRHNLKVSAVYHIPVGRSRQFFSGMNRVTDALIGGWEISGYYAFISGNPLSITTSGVTLGNNYNTRANLVGSPHIGNRSKAKWFNTAAFAAPPKYTYGNSPIGIVNGPSLNVVNLSLLKNFAWRQGDYLQIRADAFNALNHTNLSDPNVTFGSPTFGQILAAGAARTVQLGAKIVF